MVQRIVGFLLLVVLLIGGLWYSQRDTGPLKVSGFVEADEIRLGSRVGGRVHAVMVEEGQRVEAGDVLVELEPFDLLERRAEAEALWNQRTSEHEKLTAGFREEEIAQAKARYDQAAENLTKQRNGPRPQEIEAAQADVNLALAELELAQEVYARTTELRKQGAATQETLDRAVKEQRAASARVAARKEQLELLQVGTRAEEIAIAEAQVREAEQSWQLMKTGYRDEEIAQAYSAMRGAESALQALDRQLEELKIRAPSAGTIEAVDLQPGDLVSSNAPVLSMLDTRRMWIRAYVPENHLHLSLGQKLSLTVDSFPGETFSGVVTFVSREAEFTPGNVQTPEERSKQVFRIKVTLQDERELLRPGMAADVWLEGTP